MTTTFNINNVTKTNGGKGTSFDGDNGTAAVKLTTLEPYSMTGDIPKNQPKSYNMASYGNSCGLLGNMNTIKSTDCSDSSCEKTYNTSLSITKLGQSTGGNPNPDLSSVTITVTNTVPSSNELKAATPNDGVAPYGSAIVGTYQIGYENLVGGPKKLYSPSTSEQANYIINSTDADTPTTIKLGTSNWKQTVGRLVVADSTSYKLNIPEGLKTVEAVLSSGDGNITKIITHDEIATGAGGIPTKNQYNKCNAYTGWANSTDMWSENATWPPTPPAEGDPIWPYSLSTKIGVIRTPKDPTNFWNGKMAFQYVYNNLMIANSPQSKYAVYDGNGNMPSKFPDSLIMAGTLQQAFPPYLKFPNTTFEPVCKQSINITNAENDETDTTSLETDLNNNYGIVSNISSSDNSPLDSSYDLTLKNLKSQEEFEISLSLLFTITNGIETKTWAYTPGYKNFGNNIDNNKYAEMTYVNIGYGPNSKYKVQEGSLSFDSTYKGSIAKSPTISSRLPSGYTAKNVYAVNVGTVMVELYGKDVLFNRYPIQPTKDVPNPAPAYSNCYNNFLSEDWNYQLIFNVPDEYSNGTATDLGENYGQWVLRNQLSYEDESNMNFTKDNPAKLKTTQPAIIHSSMTYSCLLPTNYIISANDKKKIPNVTWASTIPDPNDSSKTWPFSVKHITLCEQHTVKS